MPTSEPMCVCGHTVDRHNQWFRSVGLAMCADCDCPYFTRTWNATPPNDALQPAPEASRDWPEDFAHENGNYSCRCLDCGRLFLGHKRRVTCKVCATAPAASGEPSDEALIATLAEGQVWFYLGKPDVLVTVKDRHDEAVRMVEARLAALRAEVEAGQRDTARVAHLERALDSIVQYRVSDDVFFAAEDANRLQHIADAALSTPTSGDTTDGR